MDDYPATSTIRERLPYSPGALGFDDNEYNSVLDDMRKGEIERIESWGSVVTSESRAADLHDGSDPRTAFEEFAVTNDVDGRAARRITKRRRQRRASKRHSDMALDSPGRYHGTRSKQYRSLPLPGRPAQSVDSVDLLDRDEELVIDEDVYLDGNSLVLARDASVPSWPVGRRNVRVKYTFGNDGVPARIRDALVDLVHIRLAKDQALAVESEGTANGSVKYRDPGAVLSSAFGTVLSETEDDDTGGVFSV